MNIKIFVPWILITTMQARADDPGTLDTISTDGRVNVQIVDTGMTEVSVTSLDGPKHDAVVEQRGRTVTVENDRWFRRDRVLLKVNASIRNIMMRGRGVLTVDATVNEPIDLHVDGNICVTGSGSYRIRSISGRGILNLNLVDGDEPRIEFSGIVRRTSACEER